VTGLALAALALVLAAAAPRVMAPRTGFRRAPRAALVAWQSVTVAGVGAALAAAPSSVLAPGWPPGERWSTVALALTAPVSLVVLARLLLSGHRVGTRLRVVRARHRELVDLVAGHDLDRLRVLRHPALAAYCIPGRHGRVVVSEGVLATLGDDEVEAVVAHEEAHLRARHDLLLEFFTVIHEAVPPLVRSEAALAEVRLLVEALADRAAARRVGEVAMARALVALAAGRTPGGALADGDPNVRAGRHGTTSGGGSEPHGVGTGSAANGATAVSAAVRLRLLAARETRWLAGLAYTYAAVVLAMPLLVIREGAS
jgi:Zn-dependent protease with chaperone function